MDLEAERTVRASVDVEEADPNDDSDAQPYLSGDGRVVVFGSSASDLVPGDENSQNDVFVRDLVAGTTVRANLDWNGDESGAAFDGGISADGRYVVFTSSAWDVVQGDDNDTNDVFVRDLLSGTTTRVSVDIGGGDPNNSSSSGSISADGRRVAFQSDASDLVIDDDNPFDDIFVRDLASGTTARASVDAGGNDPNDGSYAPSLSGDGRWVAFESDASDLIRHDGHDEKDVFRAMVRM